MTKSEIYSAVRNILNEQSEDAGALLKGESNLADFVNDATEQVVLDLLPDMPRQFCRTELVSLVANDEDYTLANEFWMILKVEKNVTDDMPVPVDIISPLQADEYTKVAETADEPTAVFFVGSTMYVRPIPATAKANYLKIYEVVPEAAALADTGPVYVPGQPTG